MPDKGSIILTCGCKHDKNTMGDLNSLFRQWKDEVCTRDPNNPFVEADIFGFYCDGCWKKINKTTELQPC